MRNSPEIERRRLAGVESNFARNGLDEAIGNVPQISCLNRNFRVASTYSKRAMAREETRKYAATSSFEATITVQ